MIMMKHATRMICCAVIFWAVPGLLWQADAIAQTWPNEPAGSQLLTDWGFSSQSWPPGWGSHSPPQIVSDPSAPLSPSSVAQQTYPVGFTGGVGPNNYYFPLSGGVRELYAGYWWKPSNPWQGHVSNGNKIHFFVSYGWNQVVEMYGPVNGPWSVAIYFPNSTVDNSHLVPSFGDPIGTRHIFPNVKDLKVALGQWHRIEHYVKLSSTATSRDGIIRWWVNGELLGNFTNVNYPQAQIVEFQFAPTWGGTGDTKKQTDYFQWDHVRISRPGSSAPAPPPGPGSTLKVQ
jgi:hypothetical protein